MSAADGSHGKRRGKGRGRGRSGGGIDRLSSAGASVLESLRAGRPGLSRNAIAGWVRRQAAIETEARTGFFAAPAAMMLGIALVYGAGLRPSVWLLSASSAALLLLALRLREADRVGSVCLVAGFVLAGMALSGAELARVSTTTFSGEATVRIEGRVAWRDRDDKGRLRYLVEIARTERPVLSRPPERARILVSSRHEPIAIGGLYKGLVRLRAPSGPAFPGAYDFAFGSYFSGLGAYGFGLGPPDPPLPEDAASVPTAGQRILALRLAIGERIRATISGPEGAVAAALIMGDRAGIPEEIDTWLRTTGLSHVLSISGLHMALVAGFAMVVVRAVLAAVPWCALVLPVKKCAAVAALGVATFYLLISGGNVATDRSYIMLSIMLLAVLFDRPALTLRNVALAAMVVLSLSPHALLTASFQMSFAATAAMIGAYGLYAGRRRTADRSSATRGLVLSALVFLAGLGLTSLIAGAATAPYSAYHFQRVQPFGLFANVLALPLFSLWIMPLALASMVLMPLGLDGPFLVLMGHGLTAVFEIAHVLHDRLSDAPTGLMTPASLVVLSVALMVAAFLSSAFRWSALPLAVLGLVLAPERAPPPELLVFEDGKELAIIDASGALRPLRARPNDFVLSQWQRAFPAATGGSAGAVPSPPAFTCRTLEAEKTPDKAGSSQRRDPPPMQFCTATTRSGLTVAWTDDYRETGRACEAADVAIVARAIALEGCRSGARLATLRTLRRSGSLAVSRSAETGRAVMTPSIVGDPEEWNRHRLAPWPEYWRKPPDAEATPTTRQEPG